MNSLKKIILALLFSLVLFSGCVQQTYQPPTTQTPSNTDDTAYNEAANDASNLEAGDAADLGNELDSIDSTLNDIQTANVQEIDATQ